jgi:hypothetical protein
MASEKAWYWISVGVLAVLVSNNVAGNYQGEIRCLASRSLAAFEQFPDRASGLMAMAEMMLGRGESRLARTQTTLARVQTRMSAAQSAIACKEAAFARIEAEHARMQALQELQGAVICPRQSLRMTIPTPTISISRHHDGTI